MKIYYIWEIFLLTLYYIGYIVAQDEEESIIVELQLADYDLADAYDELAEVTKNYLLHKSKHEQKIKLEKDRGELVRLQSISNRQITDVPFELLRNWTLLTKTGDYLLPKEDFNMLIDFYNNNEDLSNQAEIPTVSINSSTSTLDEKGYMGTLSTERNSSVLSKLWSSWQHIYISNKPNFLPTLNILNNAYRPNEEYSVKSYWEMLCEYENGYDKAQKLWEEVEPLYKKLHDFVKIRLCDHYNITAVDNAIPVYLLGSNFGTDWSKIADIILPHPYFYTEVQQILKQRSVKNIYKLAEGMTKNIGLDSLRKQFWKGSDFNFSSCGPHIFSQCGKQYTELLTCDKLDFTTFLDIHETAMNVALRNQDYSSLPRRDVRFSAVDEALYGLGAMIGMDNLPFYELIPMQSWTDDNDKDNRKITSLLVMALRILPKLPFYLLSDNWRLKQLDFPQENFTESWWIDRRNTQGVRGISNDEVDFLGDPFISTNKPYLSKYLGIFLQFQLHDYYQTYFMSENGRLEDFLKSDDNFEKFIQDRPNKDWLDLLQFHYGIDSISSDALLQYFGPLESYLEDIISKELSATTSADKSFKDITSVTDIVYNETTIDTLSLLNTNIGEINSADNTVNSSQERIWVIVGVGGVILVGVVIFILIRQAKRKKKKTNNRRFET